MTEVFYDISTAALMDVIDANLIEKSLSFAKFFEGDIRGPNPLCFVTGRRMPNNNGVVSARLPEGNVQKRITTVLKPFKSRKRPLTWWVGPRTVPGDLGKSLQRHGFVHNRDMIGMAMDLDMLKCADLDLELSLVHVQDLEQLKDWYDIILDCFPTTYSASYLDALAAISLRPDADWLHYVGRARNKVVGASSLFIGAGVAGLYNLGIHPAARGRGLGAWMTVQTFMQARELGYRIGTLQTTYPNALRMYHRLGFEVYCKIGIYRYIP